MRTPSDAAIAAEHAAIDAITALLDKPRHRKGLTIRQISELTGLAIGRVQLVCKTSECVLKRRSHHPHLWWNDWRECEDGFKPRRTTGRPRTRPPRVFKARRLTAEEVEILRRMIAAFPR